VRYSFLVVSKINLTHASKYSANSFPVDCRVDSIQG
jgi:hypothetical protein